jgi:divalent metal cation (Fe/Co/Zn/Cd) transporter
MRPKEAATDSTESDVRHSISLRPSPFHTTHNSNDTNPHRELRIDIPATAASAASPTGDAGHALAPQQSTSGAASVGHSTAFEALTPPADAPQGTFFSRHATSDNAATADLESQTQRPPRYTSDNDPYQLSSKLKSADEISRLRANPRARAAEDMDGGRLANCLPLASGKTAIRGKRLRQFYEVQNENIERFLKPVDDHRREAKEEFGENEFRYKIAVTGSFVANLLLAVLQVYAAVASKSLSLFTTMADALFDPLSNITLIASRRASNRVDARRFPSGKARIETAGNIVFCFLMTAVSLIIIVQSIRDLAEGSNTRINPLHLPSIIAVGVAFMTKLILFLYCYSLRTLYSQIRILWEDHRNDLMINGTGLAFSLMGSKIRWWIDPMGAIVISCLIVFLWLRTAWSEFHLLIGVSAETNILQLITYICEFCQQSTVQLLTLPAMTHSDDITAIDTVRAYYSGPRLIVEVDVVMNADDSLRHTHDTAEGLQIKLESLPSVERAYVHVDYETSHAPEHFLKKEL